MQAILSYRGRIVTQDDIVLIRQLIADNPASSRRALSQKLCEAWNWRQANGALRDMVCRSLMLLLHRGGHVELPPVRRVTRNPLARRGADRRKPIPTLVDATRCKPNWLQSSRWSFIRSGIQGKNLFSIACSTSITTSGMRSRLENI
jgi:hypothetical protein